MNVISAEQDKIDALNRKAWDIRFSDSRRCGYFSEEAIERSKPINYRKGLAEGLRSYGFALVRHSQYEQAVEMLNQAMDIFRSLGDECGQSDIHECFGIITRTSGDYKSSLEHFYNAFQLRKNNQYIEEEASTLYQLGVTYKNLGHAEKALEYYQQCIDFGRLRKNLAIENYCISDIGSIYLEIQKPEEALKYLIPGLEVLESQGNQRDVAECLDKIGQAYCMLKDYNNANRYFLTSYETFVGAGDKKGEAGTLLHLASLEMALSNADLAYDYASRCLSARTAIGDKKGQAEALLLIIGLSTDKNALPLMKMAYELSMDTGSTEIVNRLHYQFHVYYKNNRQYEKSLEHLEYYEKSEREFDLASVTQKMAKIKIAHQVEQEQLKSELYRLRTHELTGLYRDNEKLKKDLDLLTGALNASKEQTAILEMMSPPADLTAIIVNELQYPLSILIDYPVSGLEFTEEIVDKIRKSNSAEVIKMAGELKNELKKIAVHGQHAEALMKLMLRHSLPATDVRQMTDINHLVDEYLRLAYHGMRSKDKSFSADLELRYEKNGVKISIVPDQVGRAIFNILNHSFHDINEKRKILGETFEPRILITTKWDLEDGTSPSKSLLITITDNGNGSPISSTDKISGPSSPILPYRQGTDLNFSVSRAIIRAHHGEIKVDSREGEYTTFIILLPVEQDLL
jgi:two-component system NtrC family sensor kinase